MRFMRLAIALASWLLAIAPAVLAQVSPDMAAPSIVINLPSRTLELYSQDKLIKVYPVAIGKPSTPSPLGNYYITYKEVDPWWYPPRQGYAVPSGPDNPLGYRWMEFTSMYGIHGTNAPWAIGLAVSNGCIRMLEEDVEELFEVAPVGTPVRLTYDRVKVYEASSGVLSIGIYPDIYGWRDISVEEVRQRLQAYGAGGFFSDGELNALIEEEADRPIVFARLHTLRVNQKVLSEQAVTFRDVVYVPVWPVAIALGVNPEWDEPNGLVRLEKRAVPCRVIGEKIYVTADDARLLFGGQQVYSPEENCMDIDRLTICLNGRPLDGDVQTIDGVLALPVMTVAGATGQKVVRAADGAFLVEGKKAPVVLQGGVPYIQITRIYEVFRAYVYWNQQACSIEITYPFKLKGGL